MKATIHLTAKEVEDIVRAHVAQTGKTVQKCEAKIETRRQSDFMDRDSWTVTEFQGFDVEVTL